MDGRPKRLWRRYRDAIAMRPGILLDRLGQRAGGNAAGVCSKTGVREYLP